MYTYSIRFIFFKNLSSISCQILEYPMFLSEFLLSPNTINISATWTDSVTVNFTKTPRGTSNIRILDMTSKIALKKKARRRCRHVQTYRYSTSDTKKCITFS
jgi:hypothetical protein